MAQIMIRGALRIAEAMTLMEGTVVVGDVFEAALLPDSIFALPKLKTIHAMNNRIPRSEWPRLSALAKARKIRLYLQRLLVHVASARTVRSISRTVRRAS